MKINRSFVAIIMAIILPGLGQIYLSNVNNGIILISIAFWGYMNSSVPGGALILLLAWVYGIINVVSLVRLIDKKQNSYWLNRKWLYLLVGMMVSLTIYLSNP